MTAPVDDDRELLRDGRGRLRTGRQLAAAVAGVARALAAAGAAGRRVGLCYQNGLAAIEAFLAVEQVGGTRVPVDPGAPPAEAAAIFTAAGVEVVLADRAHAGAWPGRTLIHDDDAPLEGPGGGMTAPIAAGPEQTFLLYPRAVLGGRLFGIPVSYANWRAILRTNIALYRSGRYGPWREEEERFLTVQQIMHGTGFVGTFPFLEMGRPQVVLASFDAEAAAEAIARHRVTATMLVPAMLTRLTEVVAGRAATLRHVLYGGGPVTPAERDRARAALGPALVQIYGRVEGGWPLCVLGVEEHDDPELVGSCGRPIAEIETRFHPATRELSVKSEMAVREYTDPDGWCALGDVMAQGPRGHLVFQGRLDRMINTGYHVYPAEIEEVVARVPEVAAVRVVGEPSPEWGQTVVAYIVPAHGVADDAVRSAVRAALAGALARYKLPRDLRVVATLPAA